MTPRPGIAGCRRTLVFACVLGTLAGAVARAQPEAPGRASPIVVGAPSDSFPYSFVDRKGELTGFATELMRAVAAEMRVEVRFETRPSPDLTDMLRGGSVDALQLFSHTAEREAYADFSVPYLRLQGALFIASERRERFASFRDLRGGRLAVVGVGSTALAFVRDQGLGMDIEFAATPAAALRLVRDGRCDATFLSRLTALSVIREERLRGLEILGEPLTGYDVRHCFAVREGDADLLARLNEALALVHSSGRYDHIYQSWFVGIDAPMISRQQVVQWAAWVLGGFSLFACWALVRQRRMHRRLQHQAAEIAGQAEMLRALYENIPVGIVVFGRRFGATRLVAMNSHARSLPGLAASDGDLGRAIEELSWPAGWRALARAWTAAWPEPGAPIHAEQLVDGTRKVVLDTVRVALGAPAGGEARLCVVLEDITERKRTGEEVAQGRRLRAIGELVGGIAHEFNNLMSPLLLHASDLRTRRSDDAELRETMDVMIDATRRGADLTRRLLTFGRRDAGRTESIDVAAIAENCAALVRPTLDRRIHWEQDMPADLPRPRGSATDLQQVLLNLLINARDALQERLESTEADPHTWSPRLRVAARHHAGPTAPDIPHGPPGTCGWIELLVEDNGVGMDAATKERIFEPFFSTKEVGRGTGLGLATAWSMLNKAGGTIRVQSIRGAGATFNIWWPVVGDEAPRDGAHAGLDPAPGS